MLGREANDHTTFSAGMRNPRCQFMSGLRWGVTSFGAALLA
jgi:hypothetical protein